MLRAVFIVLTLATLAVVGGCAPKPLTAADMPRPKAGLWLRVSVVNGVTSTGKLCLAGKPVHIPGSAAACEKLAWSRGGEGAYEIDATCGAPDVRGDIKMRYSGDFQSSYVVDGSNVLTIAGRPPIVSNFHSTFSFAGPCPAGLAPDDLD